MIRASARARGAIGLAAAALSSLLFCPAARPWGALQQRRVACDHAQETAQTTHDTPAQLTWSAMVAQLSARGEGKLRRKEECERK